MREISLKEYYPNTYRPVSKAHSNFLPHIKNGLPSLGHTIHFILFSRSDNQPILHFDILRCCSHITVFHLACVWTKFNRVNKTKVNLLIQWSQTVLFGVVQIIKFFLVRKKDLTTSSLLN